MSLDSMAVDSTIGTTALAPDGRSARLSQALHAVQEGFDDIDKDQSGSLEWNELETLYRARGSNDQTQQANPLLQEGIDLLMGHFSDARDFVSKDNRSEYKYFNDSAQNAHWQLFRDDANSTGITRKDLDSMQFVLSEERTEQYLNGMRSREVGWGMFQLGWSGVCLTVGSLFMASPTGVGQIGGVFMYGTSAGVAYKAYNEFYNSETPQLRRSFENKRDSLASWYPTS